MEKKAQYKIAVAQCDECADKAENIRKAAGFTERAKAEGASLIVFPECWMSVFPPGTRSSEILSSAESLCGSFAKEMKKIAADYGMWVIFGMREAVPEDSEKTYNTVVVLDEAGNTAAVYRKTHLFDIYDYQESAHVRPGDRIFEPIETPFGMLGVMVCYEVRFPEVARYETLKGAEIIVMPTAWRPGTGKSGQLHCFTRCRALENLGYLVVCDSCGAGSIGESEVIDPLGNVSAYAGGEEQLLICAVDMEKLRAIRKVLPVTDCRRPELYGAASVRA